MGGIVGLVVVVAGICQIMKMGRQGCRVLLATNESAGDENAFLIFHGRAPDSRKILYYYPSF
jgi:hypothetical protein